MSMYDGFEKPAILCLHGGGTTGAIFHIQTIRLRRELSDYFDFVFIDAPFETGPGPNVLPVFEGAGPYLCWRNPEDTKNSNAPQKTVDVVKAAIADQVTKTGKHFVGVMGFSEGSRMAAGVALYQQQQRAEKSSQSTSSSSEEDQGFLFGIFLMGTTPPLTLTSTPQHVTNLLPLLSGGPPIITLPSIHAVGLKDPWKDETRKLASEHFDSRNAKVLEFDVGHHLPTVKADSVRLANEIINLYHKIIDNF